MNALTIKEIASWWIADYKNNTNDIVCSIPSLQRGAVWKANQVELLWDSLMRGFPIGSFVISQKNKKQKSKAGKFATVSNIDEKANYHLLDGQQRANTITLGFLDPFKKEHQKEKFSYLWLDIGYKKPDNSTRRFLFRIVTPAHPWGYNKNDEASRLEIKKIRGFMEEKNFKEKPKAYEGYPYEAEKPVPVAWFFELYEERDTKENFWKKIEKRYNENFKKNLFDSEEQYYYNKEVIFKCFKHIISTKIPLIELPQNSSNDDISDIENLFQRLNQQGTRLEGLELIYSMIKAYWSGIEDSLDRIDPKPMAEAYLAMAGIRVALVDYNQNKLPDEKTVQQIRLIASDNNIKNDNDKEKIEKYLGINPQNDNFDFKKDIEWVDNLLIFSEENKYGLHPVLRTNIAHKSKDVYVLLLWIASEFRKKSYKLNDDLRKRIIGVATAIAWFGDKKRDAVNKIFDILKEDPSDIEKYKNILRDKVQNLNEKQGIRFLISPSKLEEILCFENIQDNEWQEEYNFWWHIVGKFSENKRDKRKKYWESFDKGIRKSYNLLIYAQGEYMKEKFKNFDDSLDIYSEQNRPWDYDHILPSATLYNKRNLKYKKVGDEYKNCIGNLQILAFEDNRSKQDNKQNCKDEEALKKAIIATDECEKFCLKSSDFNEWKKVKGFIEASKNRMIKIYTIWWENLEIYKLFNDDKNNKEVVS